MNPRPLTDTERSLIDPIIRGLSNNQIAEETGRNPHTVKLHLTSIFKKTNVRSRTELAVLYHRNQVIEELSKKTGGHEGDSTTFLALHDWLQSQKDVLP